jgi:hypothetical protein
MLKVWSGAEALTFMVRPLIRRRSPLREVVGRPVDDRNHHGAAGILRRDGPPIFALRELMAPAFHVTPVTVLGMVIRMSLSFQMDPLNGVSAAGAVLDSVIVSAPSAWVGRAGGEDLLASRERHAAGIVGDHPPGDVLVGDRLADARFHLDVRRGGGRVDVEHLEVPEREGIPGTKLPVTSRKMVFSAPPGSGKVVARPRPAGLAMPAGGGPDSPGWREIRRHPETVGKMSAFQVRGSVPGMITRISVASGCRRPGS